MGIQNSQLKLLASIGETRTGVEGSFVSMQNGVVSPNQINVFMGYSENRKHNKNETKNK